MKPAKERAERIAVFHRESNIDSLPCLRNLILVLAEEGYEVDVFCLEDGQHVSPSFSQSGINIFANYPAWKARGVFRVFGDQRTLSCFAVRRHLRRPYHCVIGVDALGLIDAKVFVRWLKIPLVYLSTEVYPLAEVDSFGLRAVKEQEILICKEVSLFITQDAEREALLAEDMPVDHAKVCYLPNSPLGGAQRRRSSWIRSRCGLRPEEKIALHAGSVGTWVCTHQLIRSAWEWPKNTVLVLHGRSRKTRWQSDYVAALEYMARNGRVIFSHDPVPESQYAEVVTSADVGIALYEACACTIYTGANLRHIGLSSGKLSYFLQAGIPVMVSDLSALARVIDRYHCGVVVKDPSSTRDALMEIEENYAAYSAGALAAFAAELDCTAALASVARRIRNTK